ncbi:mechanosensitive ion channel family protein [Oceanidesulfovibrio marinus]|uniref:Mechanosensitive ion channel protein MscS n=1 Tax=Oceanidesulfovibrio marinus TaxID=370038 RepID=A0A6P1ZPI9_9BACT|nr:mechanosensitive ion channel family protein [Oceanidesulfovibrio marinus]TVM36438.1 mechanosensitive ion channel protein MscS [Oceanidesulfovibrio marinus]
MRHRPHHARYVRLLLACLVAACVLAPTAGAAPANNAAADAPASESAAMQPAPEGNAPAAVPQNATATARDEALRQRLQRILTSLEGIENVQVRVQDGVVWLAADAQNKAAHETALDVAQKLDGVAYVVDQISLSTAPTTRISFIMQTFRRLWSDTLAMLPVLAIAVVVFLVFVLAAVWLSRSRWLGRRFTANPLLASSLHRLLGLALFALGLLAALEMLGLTSVAGAVLGAAGLFGLTVGFALRDIMENYLAGMLLSLRSPFTVNDYVEVGEHAGSVVRMNSRELILMTLEGNHLRLPNAMVFESVITNYTRNPLRAFQVDVGVGGGEDLSEVQRIGCEALAMLPGVMDDPAPFMRVQSIGDFAVIVRFQGWVDQKQYEFLKVQSEGIRIVKEALDSAGVDMPYPRQDIMVLREPPADEAPRRRKDIEASARRADVARDTFLDEQIQEDRAEAAREGESNVLDKKTPG